MQAFAIVVSLALTAVAVALTVVAVRRMLGVIRAGQPMPGRADNPGARLWTTVKETVLHTRMLQWTWVGILHWFVFAAFIFLSTAVASAYFQLFDASWTIPFFGNWFLYEWAAEVLGVLGTLGIIPLIVYRLRNLPSDKGRASRFFGSTMWQAYFVEAMVLLESSAILFIRGAEFNLGLARGGEHTARMTGFHFPVAQLFGNLYPTGPGAVDTLENIIYGIAALKIVSAMLWLIVIATNLTMGVAWHRFTAWFNIFYKRESVGRDTDGATTALGAMKPMLVGGKPVTLEDIEEDRVAEDAVLGAGTIHDFAWKGILDFTTCTECGRCQSQCPAWNTEKPLSPKLLVMGLREHAYAAAPYLDKDESPLAQKALIGSGAAPSDGSGTDVHEWFYNPDGAAYVIDEDVLWSCTACGACVQQCPVDIEHVDHIMDMRRYQVLVESSFPSELNGLFKGMEGKGNPWNMNANARMDWAKDLPFDIKVVGDDIESLDEVDWLFWVGCAGAYEDRAKKTTRAVAELLDMAGVSFGVLGNGETCNGDPARRAGNEFLFQGLAQQNIETFKEFKVKKVVSTCAHCFNTLKNEYKDFGIELEVVHHTQLLNRLVREGKLTPVTEGAGAHQRSITYHDPCYIGRHNGVYSPPRELLQVLPGAEYKEMPRNSERSFCCGAGGARMWMEENLGSRINRNRTDEAVATGADQIAVGCPFCRVMLSDGLTAAQSDGTARESVEVLDVAQMLLASIKGEMATKLAPTSPLVEPAETPATAASVAVAAEPSAGDVTATPDTITSTADVGPAAKASGGSSLFDTPTPSPVETPETPDDASSLFDTPAPAEPTAPEAKSGGSLFDTPAPAEPTAPEAKSGGSLFDIPAEPPAQPEAASPVVEPAQPREPSSGGSLFDIPVESAPAATEPEAASPAAEPAQTPELGSGGSLFDIQPTTTESGAPQAREATSEPGVPQAKTEPVEPSVDLSAGGSLFDIPAQTEAPATPSGEPSTEAANSTVAQSPPAAASTESTLDSVPESPADPATPEVVEDALGAGDEPAGPAPSDAANPANSDAVVEHATEQSEVPTDDASQKPAAAPAASSGSAHTPRSDVDINDTGSLFDL